MTCYNVKQYKLYKRFKYSHSFLVRNSVRIPCAKSSLVFLHKVCIVRINYSHHFFCSACGLSFPSYHGYVYCGKSSLVYNKHQLFSQKFDPLLGLRPRSPPQLYALFDIQLSDAQHVSCQSVVNHLVLRVVNN